VRNLSVVVCVVVCINNFDGVFLRTLFPSNYILNIIIISNEY
jgi:hypothetical protein